MPRQKTFVLISADPHAYCEVKVNSSAPTNLSRKTKIHPPSLNPRFNEDLVLLVRKSDVLSFQVWNFRKTGRDVLIGECTLDISKKLDESDGEFASTPFQLSLEDALKVKIGELNINLTGFEKPINDADNNTELAVNEIEDLLINDTVSQNVSSTSSLQIPSSSADPPRAGASFGIAYINNKFRVLFYYLRLYPAEEHRERGHRQISSRARAKSS